MYFGSKYVYKYDHSSDESISDDDDEVLKHDTLFSEAKNSDR